MNLTIGELISEFVVGIIVSILIFFCAIVFTRGYARKKGYDPSTRTAGIVSVIWLIIDISLKFLILYILGPNMIFDVIRVVIEVLVISVVVLKIYNIKNAFKNALLFAARVQVLLYFVTIVIEIFIESYLFMIGGGDDDLFASGLMFYFCLIKFPL